MKTGLAALIHPHSLEDFMSHYEQNKPFVVHHNHANLGALQELCDQPFLASLENLLNSWQGAIQAHLPDLRDESSSIDTTVKDAQKLFDNGMGLLFNEAQNMSPLLCEWLEEIRRDLGLSALTYGRCLVYATPDGKGTAAHFDQNINFVFQVHGTKVWQMAPNDHVANPMTRHTMNGPIDPEMMNYIDRPLPSSMPKDVTTFELRPGSLLFVPRGYWHSTSADGDALALNFTFTAPTWIDLFTAALRSRLALLPEWRETANGVASLGDRQKLAEGKLDFLMASLAEELPHWRASGVLGATEGFEA